MAFNIVQAHVAHVKSMEEVQSVMAVLLENSKVQLTSAPLASDQPYDLQSHCLGSVDLMAAVASLPPADCTESCPSPLQVQRATHNIMAYRIFLKDSKSFLQVRSMPGCFSMSAIVLLNLKAACTSMPLVLKPLGMRSKIAPRCQSSMMHECSSGMQDFDDDGESAAGGRLLHLLQIVGAQDVVVVVSRWYGGILLGPARFTHINNAARKLLDQCGYISKDAGSKKKRSR